MRTIWVRLVAVAIVIGAIATGCGAATSPAIEETTEAVTGDANAPSVEEIYRGLGQTLKRPGFIFHSSVTVEVSAGPYSHTGTIQRWVDAERDVAREDTSFSPANGTPQHTATVIANGGNYYQEPSGKVSVGEPLSCRGATAAISLVLGCPEPTDQVTTTAETGQYAGKPSIVLVTRGTTRGSDEQITFTDRLHLNPKTYLSITLERDGTIDFGETIPERGTWIFTNEFVPADSVANDFFDPASIGYVERDPADQLRQTSWGIPVHWLGQHVDGTGELPPLILGPVEVPNYPGPAYKFSLNYHSATDPYRPPVLTVEEWSIADWKANDTKGRTKMPPRWETPCWEREELELPDGRATIYSGYTLETLHTPPPDGTFSEPNCPDQPHDQFIAQVELGPTLLFIQAPGASSVVRSPYDRREGMEAIVRALRPLSAS
ncbi:hypothetical protein [Nitrolancea hollandica]|uniref:Lipoprotein n=1 Tax=Nitrolancea hollandica Lb TaxID=1129897 RepID=I4EGI1_9BACT|nr:hypothetical protein [Nitrolancea hollandica]CCF83793.1 exported hypothetical protein [Nitrolancea hollandica Lb]